MTPFRPTSYRPKLYVYRLVMYSRKHIEIQNVAENVEKVLSKNMKVDLFINIQPKPFKIGMKHTQDTVDKTVNSRE